MIACYNYLSTFLVSTLYLHTNDFHSFIFDEHNTINPYVHLIIATSHAEYIMIFEVIQYFRDVILRQIHLGIGLSDSFVFLQLLNEQIITFSLWKNIIYVKHVNNMLL